LAPAEVNTWAMVLPPPRLPAPKSQLYCSELPSAEVEPLASNTTGVLMAALAAVENAAVGVSDGGGGGGGGLLLTGGSGVDECPPPQAVIENMHINTA